MVARQGASRYFIAYRAKVLLVAREQMRHETSMGNAAVDQIAEDMNLVTQDGEKTYHDIADEDAVPTVDSRRMAPASSASNGLDRRDCVTSVWECDTHCDSGYSLRFPLFGLWEVWP